MASCNFKSGGLSGLTNIDNTICVLAPNALSEKFFVFLWFWYHFLIVVVGTNLIFVIAMMFKSTTIRKIYASRYIFKEKMPKNGDEVHQKVFLLPIVFTVLKCWNIDQNMIYNPNFYCSCLSTGLSNIQSIIYNIFYLKQTIGCFFILKVRYEEDFEEFH